MKKDNEKKTEDVKVDLKHDNMEFSASTDGEDKLDFDDESYEEEEISPDELEMIDAEGDEAAYASVEDEIPADEDSLPEEDWTDDLPENDVEEDEEDIR